MNTENCCVHLRVGYTPSKNPNECTMDKWQCLDCGERFYPAQLYPTQNERIRERLLDEFAMHAVTGMLADSEMDCANATLAMHAYNAAEAMLHEREKRLTANTI